MIKSTFYLTPDGTLQEQLSAEQIHQYVESGEGLVWVDIEDATEKDGQFLADVFHFHSLAIADCVNKSIHPPKVDEFEDYLFFIIHGIDYHNESEVLETAELGLFLGKNFVVTSHDFPMKSVSVLTERMRTKGRPVDKGADFLAHDIIDAAIDLFMPVIDTLQDKCVDIEIEAIQSPTKVTISSIIQLKRSIMSLNRIMLPQREIISRISRGDYQLITEKTLVYYRNIFDHVIRIEMLCQELLDLADNILSTYMSSVANRQNESMKVLAIVAAIFMPLSLLAGIYGMNFENMPELRWEWGYFVVLGVIGTAIIIMLWFFWARNWISIGRRHVSKMKPFVVDPQVLKGYVDKLNYLDNVEYITKFHKSSKYIPSESDSREKE